MGVLMSINPISMWQDVRKESCDQNVTGYKQQGIVTRDNVNVKSKSEKYTNMLIALFQSEATYFKDRPWCKTSVTCYIK